MWYQSSVLYHIYPLGFCGAPPENDGRLTNRIGKVEQWIPHLQNLNINAVYFGPVFESDRHGYDTKHYGKIDCRLGSNQDFAGLCAKLHQANIKVILDGVFNHVGRGFWAFQDVLQKREASRYAQWFHIDFNGNNNYNDGLWYEGWECHYELVKLNLQNQEVVEHLFSCVQGWIEEFDIDGLRLDVAYMLDKAFMVQLRQLVKSIRPDFFLVGEMIHGDYNQIVNGEMLDSCTNYECYKGLYSSLNDNNLYEIAYSLNRQFGPEDWTLYKGKQLMQFVDNHDVNRIASTLVNPRHLPLIYGMLFSIPGIPCIYYGSEWGIKGEKAHGDDSLRPCLDMPVDNDLTKLVSRLANIHQSEKALVYGSYQQIYLSNRQFVFKRAYEEEQILVAVNADGQECTIHIDNCRFPAKNLITGKLLQLDSQIKMEGYSVSYYKINPGFEI